ncbi:MAG: MDR family MFS transporter [Micrococcus sp.]|nr:MDR family MFS transporter [Micrococcus sp.]
MTDVINRDTNPPTDSIPAVVTGGRPAAEAELATLGDRDDPNTSVRDGHPAKDLKVAPIIATLVITAFVMILNETILSVAFPTLMRDLGISEVTVQWLSTGFMLTLAIVIPTTGFLLNRLATRTVFITAILFFLVGTALAAFAPSFGVLMTARVIQAVGTAMILPLQMTSILALVPFQHRGTVMGLSSVVISVAPALGPTLSGIILQNLRWNHLFIVMLPIIILAFIAGLVFIKNFNNPRKLTLDVVSVVLAAIGFGGFVYGVANLSTVMDGTNVVAPIVLFVLGLLALTAFVVRQTRLERSAGTPLLNLRAFTVPTFRKALLVVLVAMFSMLGTVVVLPLYMTTSLRLDTLTVGLVLLPGGLAQAVLAPLFGNLYDRFGPRPLAVPGMALMSLGFWLQFAFLDENATVGMVITFNVLFGIGMAAVMTPLMALALGSLPRDLYADGSAILNTLQQLAGAIGTALLVALLSLGAAAAASGGAAPDVAVAAGLDWPFAVGGALTILAVLLALSIKRLPRESAGQPEAAAAH